VVLVVPRLHHHEEGITEGGHYYFSDLKEYTGRGWCLYESLMAPLMHCNIVLGLVCGLVDNARFAHLGGSGLAPGEELSMEMLQQERPEDEDGERCWRSIPPRREPAAAGAPPGFYKRTSWMNAGKGICSARLPHSPCP